MPEASSNESKWWLDDHRSSKSELTAPTGMTLNPDRAANPWVPNKEPTFVNKKRPTPARKPVELAMPGTFPPPLPQRTLTSQSSDESLRGPPALPLRSKRTTSRPNSTTSTASSSIPQPPLPRRMLQNLGSSSDQGLSSSTEQENAHISVDAQVRTEVNHLQDEDASGSSSLSGYKSLV